MNGVLTFLQRNRQRLDLGRYGVPAQLSCVLLTPRFRASSHVVFLIMPQGQAEPVLVAKTPRLAGPSPSLEREAANLRVVQGSRATIFDSIPHVIAFEPYNGRSILVETALVGQPLDRAAIRRNPAQCCWTVTDWLSNLPQTNYSSTETDPTWFKQLVERPLDYFEKTVPLSKEESQLLEQTRTLTAPLRQINLPLIFEHGDLSHPNLILLKKGGLGVVDWELAEPAGLPAYDLFFFLTYAAFALNKANSTREHLAAFHEAFFGRAAWTRPYVKTYAERLQLPMPALTPLFGLCWLRYLVGLLTRLDPTEDPTHRLGDDTMAWLRANRYYALWQYTLAHLDELDW